MKKQAYVTHQQGSWKWQKRYALIEYIAVQRKSDGIPIWRSNAVLNDKVKPWQTEGTIGSLHNKPLTIAESALFALYA